MKNKSRTFKALTATAAIACLSLGAAASAANVVKKKTVDGDKVVEETITEKTIVTETHERAVLPEGARVINFAEFDVNGDGILTREEIGVKLFHLFDNDGNHLLDNIEYTRNNIITILPIAKDVVIKYDLDGDGVPDKTEVSHTMIMEETMLSRFDADGQGLSPEKFTGRHFNIADINKDKFVDLEEWKASYNSTIDERIRRRAETND